MAHSASTILDDIIDELKLSYDSSIGILEGPSIGKVPSRNILLNLEKLLTKLSNELDVVSDADANAIVAINKALNIDGPEPEPEAEGTSGVKHELSEDSDNEPLAKRRQLSRDEPEKEDGDPNLNSENDDVPPVQNGSYTQENDTRLKNPKSEFISLQTLPAKAISELGLFSEESNGLETQGKEYLKKKYGVSSYPERDLLDLLPGEIPDIDFSKNKPPSNQVQFTTFQSYIESFFRQFVPEDINFLNQKHIMPPEFDFSNYDPEVTPFLIPRLGEFYADVWAEEDATLGAKLNSPALHHSQHPDVFKPRGSIDNLSDDKLYTEEISCGPLSNRLLSALLSIPEGRAHLDDESEAMLSDEEVATQLDTGDDYKLTTEAPDFYSVEERLKKELKYIGIFMNLPTTREETKLKINGRTLKGSNTGSILDTDEWVLSKEDDEVCAELRTLQKDLKEASTRNKSNKKKLIPIIEEQLAWQEYCTILEDLDKQVDQAYLKRLKAKNKKKKTEITTTPQQQAVNSGLKALLSKRKRWIENIGRLFKPPELMMRVPSESVLSGGDVDEGDDEDDEDEDE